MTILKLFEGIKIQLDQVDSNIMPQYLQEEVEYYINKAARNLIIQKYTGVNPLNAGFENSQKRIDDLRSLVKYDTITNFTAAFYSTPFVSGYKFELPSDYWFSIWDTITVQKPGKPVESVDCYNMVTKTESTETAYLSVLERTHNELPDILNNPFARPSSNDHVIRLISQNYMQFFINNLYTPKEYRLGYIKSAPVLQLGVTYTTDTGGALSWNTLEYPLPEHLHMEIIDTTVKLLQDNVTTARFSTQTFPE